MNPVDLLRSYVELQNRCQERRDYAPLLVLFHPDAELAFEGMVFGPFRGWERIREAFTIGGPVDQLDVIDVAWSGHRALATYAWRLKPGSIAGTLSVEGADGLITRLVIGIAD